MTLRSNFWLDFEYFELLDRLGLELPSPRGHDFESVIHDFKQRALDVGDEDRAQSFEDVFADPEFRAMMNGMDRYGSSILFQTIEESLSVALYNKSGRRYPSLIAELTTNDFNACVANLTSGYLILVNSGTPLFLNQGAKILSYACPDLISFPGNAAFYQPEKTPDGDKLEGENVGKFCSLCMSFQVTSYLGEGTPSMLSMLPAPMGRKSEIQKDIVLSAERFMVAHEHGHIVKNHEGVDLRRPSERKATGIDISKRIYNEEFEADRFALEVLLDPDVSKRDMFGKYVSDDAVDYHSYSERALAGIALFFAMDGVVDDVLTMNSGNKHCTAEQLKTHPSAKKRWQNIEQEARRQLGDQVDFATRIFDFYQDIGPEITQLSLGLIAMADAAE